MATNTRIYFVAVGYEQRLVRATHPSQALMHVARETMAVRVATQNDIVKCVADGVKPEDAKEREA